MPLSKEDLLTTFYEESRTYDLHFSNIRTTLATFFLTLGFGTAGFLHDKYRSQIPESPELQFELLCIPLFFFFIAFFLSGIFHGFTRACHRYQLSLEKFLTSDGDIWIEGDQLKIGDSPATLFREYFISHVKSTSCENIWKNYVKDGGQFVLILVIVAYCFLYLYVSKNHWTKNTASADSLTLQVVTTGEDQGHLSSMLISWNDKEKDEATVYKATVVDELDVPVCQSGLITTRSYTCKGLHRAGDGLPISSKKIPKLRVRVEASRLEPLRKFTENMELRTEVESKGIHPVE